MSRFDSFGHDKLGSRHGIPDDLLCFHRLFLREMLVEYATTRLDSDIVTCIYYDPEDGLKYHLSLSLIATDDGRCVFTRTTAYGPHHENNIFVEWTVTMANLMNTDDPVLSVESRGESPKANAIKSVNCLEHLLCRTVENGAELVRAAHGRAADKFNEGVDK